MKIVHVETGRHFYGGAQQVVWLVRGLVDRGVDSLLVCTPGSAIDKVARDAGLEVANVACAGEHDLRFAWRLHSLLRKEKPDILHCHSRRGADFPGGWAAVSSRTPAIVSRRVDSPESPTAAAIRYAPFKKIVAISEHIAAVLGKSRIRGKRLSVIRSAVDADAVKSNVDRAITGFFSTYCPVCLRSIPVSKWSSSAPVTLNPRYVHWRQSWGCPVRFISRDFAMMWTTTWAPSICWSTRQKKKVSALRC
jgi:hypothetical protein